MSTVDRFVQNPHCDSEHSVYLYKFCLRVFVSFVELYEQRAYIDDAEQRDYTYDSVAIIPVTLVLVECNDVSIIALNS